MGRPVCVLVVAIVVTGLHGKPSHKMGFRPGGGLPYETDGDARRLA